MCEHKNISSFKNIFTVSASLSASKLLRAASGTLAKASLVGAKMVKASASCTVDTRPAAFTAVTRVENLWI